MVPIPVRTSGRAVYTGGWPTQFPDPNHHCDVERPFPLHSKSQQCGNTYFTSGVLDQATTPTKHSPVLGIKVTYCHWQQLYWVQAKWASGNKNTC